jgi:hypothetical protein
MGAAGYPPNKRPSCRERYLMQGQPSAALATPSRGRMLVKARFKR